MLSPIDLSQYLDSKVEVVLRSGAKLTGKVSLNQSHWTQDVFPFKFQHRLYLKNGFWSGIGRPGPLDIVSVKTIDNADSPVQELQELRQKVKSLEKEIDSLKNPKPTLPKDFSRKYCLKLLNGETSRSIVRYVFFWHNTPQGYMYWKSIADAFDNGDTLPKEALDYIKDLVILSYRQEQGE